MTDQIIEKLEKIKAAIGDRLLAKGPLSKPYAHEAIRAINEAIEALNHMCSVAARIEIIVGYNDGLRGSSLIVNDFRVAGPKQYGATIVASWNTTGKLLVKSLLGTRHD